MAITVSELNPNNPIDPAKAVSGLKLKYTSFKPPGSSKSGGGTAAVKKSSLIGVRPRRKAYGPF